MEDLSKQEAPATNQNSVAPICVFQIMEDLKIVDYGIGVLFNYGNMVTFGKYFDNGRTIGRIFFKKVSKDEKYPLTFDTKGKNLTDFIITEQQNSTKLSDGRFVNIALFKDFEEHPEFLPKNEIKNIDYGKKGYAIGLNKSKGSKIQLNRVNFELDSHIMDLRLKYKEAVLFIFKQDQEYCYGFYEEATNADLGNDLYLQNELLVDSLSHKEGMIVAHQEKEVQDPVQGVPFQYIGILRFGEGSKEARGTAQLLENKDGCKYLITCAHNFIGAELQYTINNQQKRIYSFYKPYNFVESPKIYSFELPRNVQYKPLRYKMERLEKEEFQIQTVYIPKEYTDFFKMHRFKQAEQKYITFPQETQATMQFRNSYYDIAIIKLKNNIKRLTRGFVIEDEDKPIQFPVEVSGFPEGLTINGKTFGIIQGKMYTESTAVHDNDPSYVQLSKDQNGSILMLHRLSTLPGNSGSPIYERISETECRLIGIHTRGYREQSIDQKKQNPNPTQEQLYYKYNLGTYIHSPNIKSWLNSVLKK